MLIVGAAYLERAHAAIPDSGTGLIQACYHKNSGALRVIDAEAGEACLPSEQPLSWPGQLAAAQGPVAYALVDAVFDSETETFSADVDESRSSGITDEMVTLVEFAPPLTGVQYCFVVPFAFKNIVLTPIAPSNSFAAPLLGVGAGCPAGTDFYVQLINSITFEAGVGSFYILIH